MSPCWRNCSDVAIRWGQRGHGRGGSAVLAGIRYSGACRVLCSHHVALLVQLLGHSFQVWGVEEVSRRSV